MISPDRSVDEERTATAHGNVAPRHRRNDGHGLGEAPARVDRPCDARRHLETTTVRPTATGFLADGSVTVKGHTSPVAVSIENVAITGDTARFTATNDVDRNDVGVDKMPSLIVGSKLDLTVSAAATRTT